mgnify:CR=1 FL=1
MSLIPHGICILFGQGNPFQGINDLFKGLEELAMAIAAAIIIVLIILVVVLIVAGVGLGAITGMGFKKAASDELDEAEAGSTTVTSRIRGCVILLVGPVFAVGALLFSFFAFLAAEDRGFDEDWLPTVMILGVVAGIVFTIGYQQRRIRRLGAEKAKGIFFILGLLVSGVFIGVMGSVSTTSLVYIAIKRFAPSLEDLPNISMSTSEGFSIRWDTRTKNDENNPSQMTSRDFSDRLLDEAPLVQHLNLYGHAITNAAFSDLHRLQHLTRLHVISKHFTDDSLNHIAKIQTLEYLKIESPINDNSLRIIGNMKQLIELDISATPITDNGLEHLRNLNLDSLRLSHDVKTDIGLINYLAAVKPQPKLNLRNWRHLKGPGLAHIKPWLQMEEEPGAQFPHNASFETLEQEAERIRKILSLPSNLESGEGIKYYLTAIDNAAALNFRRRGLTGVEFEEFELLPDLQYLNLAFNPIHPDAYSSLKNCKNLRVLQLDTASLNHKSMEDISQISSLEFLDLTRCRFPEDSFLLLANLSNLKRLNLYLVNVDQDTLATFMSALPECSITRN